MAYNCIIVFLMFSRFEFLYYTYNVFQKLFLLCRVYYPLPIGFLLGDGFHAILYVYN